jgi:hypothetical protein
MRPHAKIAKELATAHCCAAGRSRYSTKTSRDQRRVGPHEPESRLVPTHWTLLMMRHLTRECPCRHCGDGYSDNPGQTCTHSIESGTSCWSKRIPQIACDRARGLVRCLCVRRSQRVYNRWDQRRHQHVCECEERHSSQQRNCSSRKTETRKATDQDSTARQNRMEARDGRQNAGHQQLQTHHE